MKILVYGAGAVGGYLGARLAHNQHEVTLITRPTMVEVLTADGLAITEKGQTIRTRPQVMDSVHQAFEKIETPYDLIIMAMKSYDLRSAMDPLVAFCPQPKVIIAVQNGIGVEQPLIKQFGAEHVIAGSLTTPISKETTNSLVVEKEGRGLGLSPTKTGQDIRQWVALFQKAGIETIGLPDYQAMRWSKAFLNIVGNATSAILNRSPGVLYKNDKIFDLEVRMLRETLAVMKKLGLKTVDLPGSPAGRLAFGLSMPKLILQPILSGIVASGRGGKMPSFHIDLTADKGKTEVGFHNGAIARAGEANGVPTPVNAVLNDVLEQLTTRQLNWRDFDGRPGKLLAAVKAYES